MSDLISRQAAIDAIHNLYAIHGSEGSWIDQKDAFKALNSLPSAQPVRHAKWNCSDDMFEYAICSACKWDSGEALEYAKKNFIYCPNCGARMDEE